MKNFVVSKERITKRDSKSINLYFDELHKIKSLTPDEEYELAVKSSNGDLIARQKLISANLRFVISVAKQYASKNVSLEDLINEGNIGLVKAAAEFDPTRGFKFISYAVWWIRQKMILFIHEKSNTVKRPTSKNNKMYAINQRINLLEQKLERPASYGEILEELENDFTKDYIDFYVNSYNTNDRSLDESLGGDGDDFSLLDLLGDDSIENAIEVLNKDDKNTLYQILFSKLTEDEALITQKLYGFNGESAMSVNQIAREFGVTPTVITQRRSKILRKLKFQLRNRASWMLEE